MQPRAFRRGGWRLCSKNLLRMGLVRCIRDFNAKSCRPHFDMGKNFSSFLTPSQR